jgi:2-keto-4-pentenoate hydratase
MAEAYRVQAAVHARLAATRYGRRTGYKIGCTTKVMQDYLGIPSPCAAGVFAGTTHASGVDLRAADFRRIGVECEIAVRLARDLPSAAAPYDAASVASAIAVYMAAIEVVDDRYADWRTTDTPTLVADDFFAAGVVLGLPVAASAIEDPARLAGRTEINGAEVGRGEGSDVLGTPLAALVWLANELAGRGEALKAGEIVLTGSLVETRWLARGDRAAIEIAGLGQVELSVT